MNENQESKVISQEISANREEDLKLREWVSFIEAFCDNPDPAKLLDKKAWSRIDEGMCPIDAYCLQQIEEIKGQIKLLAQELRQVGLQKKAEQKSPGSVANLYASPPSDPFIEGLLGARQGK